MTSDYLDTIKSKTQMSYDEMVAYTFCVALTWALPLSNRQLSAMFGMMISDINRVLGLYGLDNLKDLVSSANDDLSGYDHNTDDDQVLGQMVREADDNQISFHFYSPSGVCSGGVNELIRRNVRTYAGDEALDKVDSKLLATIKSQYVSLFDSCISKEMYSLEEVMWENFHLFHNQIKLH